MNESIDRQLGESAYPKHYFLAAKSLKKEEDIKVGVSWKYKDLSADECLLSADYQSKYGLEVG